MLVKCPKCGYIIKIPARYPPKGISLEVKRKRDRFYDRQKQESSLILASLHWDKWGSDEIEYMRQCAEAGKTRMEVALDLGRTFYSVNTKARKQKIRFMRLEKLVNPRSKGER